MSRVENAQKMMRIPSEFAFVSGCLDTTLKQLAHKPFTSFPTNRISLSAPWQSWRFTFGGDCCCLVVFAECWCRRARGINSGASGFNTYVFFNSKASSWALICSNVIPWRLSFSWHRAINLSQNFLWKQFLETIERSKTRWLLLKWKWILYNQVNFYLSHMLILHIKPSILQHNPTIWTQQHNAKLSSLLKQAYGFVCAYQTLHWVYITYNINSMDRSQHRIFSKGPNTGSCLIYISDKSSRSHRDRMGFQLQNMSKRRHEFISCKVLSKD